MELDMVINNKTVILATEIIEEEALNKWLFRGMAFDGDFGFGDDTTRFYKGQVALISSNRKEIIEAEVYAVHSTRIPAPLWLVNIGNCSIKLPNPPFLLTSILESYIFLHDYIELAPSAEAEKIFYRDGVGDIYPICASSWFGIVEYKENNRFILTAYSANEDFNANSFTNENLIFSEWDVPVGLIKLKS